jgi:hypothetical protein
MFSPRATFSTSATTPSQYLWNDPDEATIANYLRSGLHGMVIAVFGWMASYTLACAPADG